MAGYSRTEILERMKGSNITLGWGAVAVFDRARLNNLLEQQYLSRMHEHRYLPDFSKRFSDPQLANAFVEVDIEFGTPRLSFENASITGSRASLRMNVIGGRVVTRRLADERLQGTFDLNEGMGFSVVMDIDLALIQGQVDKRGTVSLDMARGSQLSCDLPVGALQRQLNQALQTWFGQLPAHRTVFSLGVIEFIGDGPLTPKSFIIRTQAAPGAVFTRSENFGDGAVLTFIQLQGNDSPGRTPDSGFPYLIPDDLQGSDARYSATVVVAENMLEHVGSGQLQVLGSLLFPGSQAFYKVDEETPRDLAVFGNIAPLSSSLRLEPSMVTLRPGAKQTFKLLDAKGNPLAATAWTAVSLKSHLSEGNGSIDSSGNYTAAASSVMGHETLTVVVTATYRKNGKDYQASARVFVMHEGVQLAPRITTQVGAGALVALQAGHAGGSKVNWSLAGPLFGALTETENGAVFSADSASDRLPIALQRVQAEHGSVTQGGILMLNAWFPVPSLKLASAAQGVAAGNRIKPGQVLQFTFPHADFLPDATRHWRTLGAGSVDKDGKYTAHSDVASGADGVVCDLEHDNVTFNGAYQLLRLSTLEEEGTWKELQTFKVTQIAKQEKMYANGYQQLQIDIEVETADVDGKNYPLSPKERASIVLVEQSSKPSLKMLPDAVQGIEGTEPMYATRETRNVFKMPIGAGQAPARKAGNSVYRTLFLHMKDSTSTGGTFYARFTKDGGGEFNSNEKFGEDGFVKVSPLAPPVLNPDSYQFIPKRVKGNGNADKEDDFHFNLRTRDYWSFRYRGGDLFMREFLARTPDWGVKTDINKSMLRFENDHPNEIMVSYMGSIFEPKFKGVVNGQKEDDSEVLKVDFDLVGDDKKALTTVKNPWGTDVESTVFEPGTFVIVNDRLDDATYIPADQRKRLSQSMVVKFVDDMGNAHHVQFNYGPADYAGDRNNVNVALVTPQ